MTCTKKQRVDYDQAALSREGSPVHNGGVDEDSADNESAAESATAIVDNTTKAAAEPEEEECNHCKQPAAAGAKSSLTTSTSSVSLSGMVPPLSNCTIEESHILPETPVPGAVPASTSTSLSSSSSSLEKSKPWSGGRNTRSVVDFETEDDIRAALANITIGGNGEVDANDGSKIPDWKLPCHDPEAEEQTLDGELKRLLVLKSYLLLDAEQEEAFDALTEEARKHFNVPTSLISLIDLGRQFFFAQSGNPNPAIRETPRNLAMCAHTILSKKGICVVKDTKDDSRFKNSVLVTEAPHLRFYAAAPLISPEGYKLGTFCVEGPEPRPNGLTQEEQDKLKEFAAKAMDLMVQRRKLLRERLHKGMTAPANEGLRRHAAVATNLGGVLYRAGHCMNAMRLYQESVQTLMYVEEEGGGAPPPARQEMLYKFNLALSRECIADEERQTLIQQVKDIAGEDRPVNSGNSLVPFCRNCVPDGIPGLFGVPSKLRGSVIHHETGLVFNEAFQISMEDSRAVDYRNFIIPLNQCSKATLFNMGLIHYHWGSPDSAMQFFDLAASLSQMNHSPLSFDPVVLACLNNMAQINLQYGRGQEAMELLGDALARGNAALAAMYADEKHEMRTHQDVIEREQIDLYSRRLRRKLARTVMNMGHVHYFNCEYDQSFQTCVDAMRLLHTTSMEDTEAAAAWYNMAVLHYHKGNKIEALLNVDKFINRARVLVGPTCQIADGFYRKGQILFEMGRLYESMIPHQEALGIRRRLLGEQHFKVAESLVAVGRVYQSREEYEFAIKTLEEALAIMRNNSNRVGAADAQQQLGERQPKELPLDAAQTLLELGRAHHMLGHTTESLAVYQEVLNMARRFFGEKHVFVARILKIIGNLHLEAGNVTESVQHFTDATKMNLENGMPVDYEISGGINSGGGGLNRLATQESVKPLAPPA